MGPFYKSQLRSVARAKSAIYDWLHISATGHTKRQTQRIVLTNVMISVTSILSFGHAIMLAVYDFDQLIIPITLLLFIGTIILATPFLNKIHPYLGSVYNLSLWLVHGCILTFMFGTASGIYFYFLAGAASAILIMGVYHNLLSIFSMSLQIAMFTYFDRTEIPSADFLHLAPFFYTGLHFSSILLSMFFIYCMVYYAFHQAQLAEDALEREYEYSEKLLTNMLPASIATQLKHNQGETIAENHDEVTILFADIVGFTPRAESQSATELVRFLNNLFTRFDHLAEKHGLEKIKTIGDAFMVAGGMPDAQPDHTIRMAHMALDMMDEARKYTAETGETVELRIGIHTGPAAGQSHE